MRRTGTLAMLVTAVALALLAPDGATAAAGRVSGAVILIGPDGAAHAEHSGAVVYLEGVPGPFPDTSREVHSIHQRNKQFEPRQLVVLKGSTIEFPNDDRIDHNVFSLSRALRFDLGMYRSGVSRKIIAKRAGVVDVFCNIHAEMSAKILVLETPYYAVTDARGRYTLRGVPPGHYTLRIWHARGEPQHAEVDIAAGASTEKSLKIVVSDRPERHLRKNGTPYGRYQ
jgi:plastocyanin